MILPNLIYFRKNKKIKETNTALGLLSNSLKYHEVSQLIQSSETLFPVCPASGNIIIGL